MKKISSDKTFLHKSVYPLFMLVVSGAMLLIFVGTMVREREISFVVLGFIGLAIVYVYSEYRKRAVDLVDEVWDDGDTLVLKNGGREERVAISNISKLRYGGLGNANFVALTLREPCAFGQTIRFVPLRKMYRLFKNPLIMDLATRVKHAAGQIE